MKLVQYLVPYQSHLAGERAYEEEVMANALVKASKAKILRDAPRLNKETNFARPAVVMAEPFKAERKK